MASFFVTLGIIIMVLSGGCTFAFLSQLGFDADFENGYLQLVMMFSGPPLIVGMIMFLVARGVQKKAAYARDQNERNQG